MKQIMAEVIPARLVMLADGTAPSNLTTWHTIRAPEEKKGNLLAQAHTQLVASMAALHTTTMLSTHVIFDLLARPQYIEPLRRELEEVLAGQSESYPTKNSMPRLRKLDSFMKESQRFNPLGLLTFERKVLRDITLHDGVVLPKGCHYAVPAHFYGTDKEMWERPHEFDGYRFLKLRGQKKGTSSAKFTFIETGVGENDIMAFGHGVHACPGRFFANNEIKVILTYLLLNYDMKLPPGEGRPANLHTAGGFRPDFSKNILMRRRMFAARE